MLAIIKNARFSILILKVKLKTVLGMTEDFVGTDLIADIGNVFDTLLH